VVPVVLATLPLLALHVPQRPRNRHAVGPRQVRPVQHRRLVQGDPRHGTVMHDGFMMCPGRPL
jgi:hypothetical protein